MALRWHLSPIKTPPTLGFLTTIPTPPLHFLFPKSLRQPPLLNFLFSLSCYLPFLLPILPSSRSSADDIIRLQGSHSHPQMSSSRTLFIFLVSVSLGWGRDMATIETSKISPYFIFLWEELELLAHKWASSSSKATSLIPFTHPLELIQIFIQGKGLFPISIIWPNHIHAYMPLCLICDCMSLIWVKLAELMHCMLILWIEYEELMSLVLKWGDKFTIFVCHTKCLQEE